MQVLLRKVKGYLDKKRRDYHEEMTANIFRDWFLNRFLIFLEEGSIIVMDNAPYHSVTTNKVPNTSTRIQDIINWLDRHDIDYTGINTRTKLLTLVQPYRNQPKQYELDQLANERGHLVITANTIL